MKLSNLKISSHISNYNVAVTDKFSGSVSHKSVCIHSVSQTITCAVFLSDNWQMWTNFNNSSGVRNYFQMNCKLILHMYWRYMPTVHCCMQCFKLPCVTFLWFQCDCTGWPNLKYPSSKFGISWLGNSIKFCDQFTTIVVNYSHWINPQNYAYVSVEKTNLQYCKCESTGALRNEI